MAKMVTSENLATALTYVKNTYGSKIEELNSRSVIGAKGEYGYFKLSADYTSAIAEGTIIPFDTIVETNKVELGTSTGSVVLHKGVTYRLTLQMFCGGVSSNASAQFFNVTKGEFIGHQIYAVGVSYNSTVNSGNDMSIIYTPTEDSEINVKIASSFGSTTVYPTNIYNTYTALLVEEITRTLILDPVQTAQDNDIKYGTFATSVTGSLSANTPIKLDSVVNGTMELDTTLNGIKLTGGKKYKIQLVGAPVLTAIANAKFYLYNCTTSTTIADSLLCIVTTATATTHWLTTGSGIYFTPDSDMSVSIVCDKAIDKLRYTEDAVFHVLVEEIKNPVLISKEITNEVIKEYSNPLTSSEISQETPIGAVIEYWGATAPEHYLACNGDIVNIADYPKLFEIVGTKYGGDGVLTFGVPDYRENVEDITPILTSNVLPSPYVASASTEYSGLQAYKAFDQNIDTGWSTASSTTTGWIKLDLGVSTEIGAISITARNLSTTVTSTPRSFTIEGSNDDSVFDTLKEVKDEINWTIGESRTFKLDKEYSYRYIRISVTANNGGDRVVIGELKLYKRSEEFSKCIKCENTHYAVNQYGGFQMDILFEGMASQADTKYDLDYNVNDYDYIIVEADIYYESAIYSVVSGLFTKDTIKSKRCAVSFFNMTMLLLLVILPLIAWEIALQ